MFLLCLDNHFSQKWLCHSVLFSEDPTPATIRSPWGCNFCFNLILDNFWVNRGLSMIFDPGGPWVWRLNSKSGRGPKLSFHHWGHFQRKFQARPNHFVFHNLNVLTTVVDFISKTWFVLIFLSWMFQAGKREHSVQLGRWRWKVATRCMTPVSEICVFETKT